MTEERQIQELRKLQVDNGIAVKTTDSSLDWMYEGPAGQSVQQETAEQYLLGKIYKPKNEDTNDVKQLGTFYIRLKNIQKVFIILKF